MIGDNAVKTTLAAVIGLMISSVGIDANTGIARFTFGVPDLLAGIDFLVIVIGLFGMAELFTLVERQFAGHVEKMSIGRTFVSWADLAKVKFTVLRSASHRLRHRCAAWHRRDDRFRRFLWNRETTGR